MSKKDVRCTAGKYYGEEFDITEILMDNGMINDLFHYKDLQNRKLYLNTEITNDSVFEIVRHIIQYNKEDTGVPREERRPIKLYIDSPGGDVISGFQLIDVIQSSVTPIVCIDMGMCYSMAVPVFVAGHKRYAMQNASFLIHDGTSMVYDSSSKAQDTMEFTKTLQKKIKDQILEKTNIPEATYKKKRREEWYIGAAEAKEYGICEAVVGVDVALEEIA